MIGKRLGWSSRRGNRNRWNRNRCRFKIKVPERLDLGKVFGTDNVCTVEWQTRRDFRIHLDDEGLSLLDDEVDNEEGCSKVEIEEMDRSFFTLPPPEKSHRYLYLFPKNHHYYHHHYYHHYLDQQHPK